MRDDQKSRVRLFFAALPDAAARERLAAAAQALHVEWGVRWVPRDDFHATVAFIGEVATPDLATLRDVGAAQRVPSFTLRFDAYEYWPKPQVIVAAARVIPAALERLWQQLHRALAVHHWALEPKRLRPHVTLAKKVSQAPVLQAMSSVEWKVHEFSLMRSDASGAKSAYTVVDSWPLLDESAETSKNSAI